MYDLHHVMEMMQSLNMGARYLFKKTSINRKRNLGFGRPVEALECFNHDWCVSENIQSIILVPMREVPVVVHPEVPHTSGMIQIKT